MKKSTCYFGVCIGIICIIFSFVTFSGSADIPPSFYTDHDTYGGDAYTGIQNAAADAANNITKLSSGIESLYDKISLIGGFILMISGALIILHYFEQLVQINEYTGTDSSQTPENVKYENGGYSLSKLDEEHESAENNNSWECSKCGSINKYGSSFCKDCGAYK